MQAKVRDSRDRLLRLDVFDHALRLRILEPLQKLRIVAGRFIHAHQHTFGLGLLPGKSIGRFHQKRMLGRMPLSGNRLKRRVYFLRKSYRHGHKVMVSL